MQVLFCSFHLAVFFTGFLSDCFLQYYYSVKDISVGGMCICFGHARACPLDPVTNVCIFIGWLGKTKLWAVNVLQEALLRGTLWAGVSSRLRQCNRKLCQREIELVVRIDFEISHHCIRNQISFSPLQKKGGSKQVFLFWNLFSYDSLQWFSFRECLPSINQTISFKNFHQKS